MHFPPCGQMKLVDVKLLFLARNQACECCVSINVSFFETLENIKLTILVPGTTLFYDIKDDKENINRLVCTSRGSLVGGTSTNLQ